ncbi:hypothetical protein QQS21_005162 [Conoideocrella luteorostrata]|uniref:Nephrocystin 3-like N-terminal domain-containing protein n=1 Tax=Conoideocrella luteorostrata TaxID=1105319 RepID=A0AAJ0FZ84_9HYPO|nr:hypothetical protein QQS21_005162 [Conoideocrella luteorostrata]
MRIRKAKTNYAKRNPFGKLLSYNVLVVPEASACIDGHDKIGLDSDHFKLNKFYGSDDASFKALYPAIKRLVDAAPKALETRRRLEKNTESKSTVFKQLQDCLRALRGKVTQPVDVLSKVKSQKGERLGNTCEWILTRTEFSNWTTDENSQFLRLVGCPGIGKTMMSTFLVDSIKDRVGTTLGANFAYFFFDDKDEQRNTATALLQSTIYQLLVQKHNLFRHMQADFEAFNDADVSRGLFDDFEALWRIFKNMIEDEQAGEVFLLIDALDECEKSSLKDLVSCIAKLFPPVGPNVCGRLKVLITCRPEIKYIEKRLKSVGHMVRMDRGTINRDLQEYIENEVTKLADMNEYGDDLRKMVESTLNDQAGGTFLWVSFMIKVLIDTDRYLVEEQLKNLPSGLDETYSKILQGIDPEKQEGSRFLLRLLTAARRPMSKIEIAAAFAMKNKQKLTGKPGLYNYLDVYTSCGSLIHLDIKDQDDDTTVMFCHQSVKDFLLRQVSSSKTMWYQYTKEEANMSIFEICWRYLGAEEFEHGDLLLHHDSRSGKFYRTDIKDLRPKMSEYPLLSYAFHYWKDHAAASYPLHLCDSYQPSIRATKAARLRDWWLFKTAVNGHADTVALLIEYGCDPEQRDSLGRTPLRYAVECSQQGIVQMLLEKGADVNTRSDDGTTPLYRAISRKHRGVVQLLLEKGASTAIKNEDGSTPLHLAVSEGRHEDPSLVELLLQAGADTALQDKNGKTPLHLAVKQGHKQIIELLLKRDAAINISDENGRAPLHLAVGGKWQLRKHFFLVELLLQAGANIALQDKDGETPLHLAVDTFRHEHLFVVELLLQKGANTALKDTRGRTPLHIAAHRGHKQIIELLLRRGASIHVKDNFGETPHFYAARAGRETVVKLLLDKGAKLNMKNGKKRTLLFAAAHGGIKALIVLLLDKGANVNERDKHGQTPLFAAVEGGKVAAVKILLVRGADIHAEDRHGQTALFEVINYDGLTAAELSLERRDRTHRVDRDGDTVLFPFGSCIEDAAALLLEKGANIDQKNRFGVTPLGEAIQRGQVSAATFLIRNGADVNHECHGISMLEQAAWDKSHEVVDLLLKSGAVKGADSEVVRDLLNSRKREVEREVERERELRRMLFVLRDCGKKAQKTMSSHDELKLLITPSLLKLIAEAQIPHSKTEALNFADVAATMSSSHFKAAIEPSTARAALVAISRLSPKGTLPPTQTLDLMSFLPPPSSAEFPQQCYGLQLLLDQASRVLFSGIDHRWQSAYFGPLARRLAGQWYQLPTAQRPDSLARWETDVGVRNFDYWIAGRIVWLSAFSHDEDLESQRIGLELSEETRAIVEARTGTVDPYRATRDALLVDDLAFPREMVKGPPKNTDNDAISMNMWAFWWCMIIDAHWPIIERFGRYPYRNAVLGRESTEEEKKWLDDTGHIAEAPSHVAERIQKDIADGIWTPLGGGMS